MNTCITKQPNYRQKRATETKPILEELKQSLNLDTPAISNLSTTKIKNVTWNF